MLRLNNLHHADDDDVTDAGWVDAGHVTRAERVRRLPWRLGRWRCIAGLKLESDRPREKNL